jgi:hypothetical protein
MIRFAKPEPKFRQCEGIEKIVGVMFENRSLGLDLAVINQGMAVYC